jgi:hypothetical protein
MLKRVATAERAMPLGHRIVDTKNSEIFPAGAVSEMEQAKRKQANSNRENSETPTTSPNCSHVSDLGSKSQGISRDSPNWP